jgi:hypothetical protein
MNLTLLGGGRVRPPSLCQFRQGHLSPQAASTFTQGPGSLGVDCPASFSWIRPDPSDGWRSTRAALVVLLVPWAPTTSLVR